MLPNARVTNAYLRRGVSLWILVRLFASAVILLGSSDRMLSAMAAELAGIWRTGSVGFVLAVFLLAHVDVRMRKERALIANLGFPVGVIAAVGSAPALAGEILISLIGLLW
jgi:hypothetical protein